MGLYDFSGTKSAIVRGFEGIANQAISDMDRREQIIRQQQLMERERQQKLDDLKNQRDYNERLTLAKLGVDPNQGQGQLGQRIVQEETEVQKPSGYGQLDVEAFNDSPRTLDNPYGAQAESQQRAPEPNMPQQRMPQQRIPQQNTPVNDNLSRIARASVRKTETNSPEYDATISSIKTIGPRILNLGGKLPQIDYTSVEGLRDGLNKMTEQFNNLQSIAPLKERMSESGWNIMSGMQPQQIRMASDAMNNFEATTKNIKNSKEFTNMNPIEQVNYMNSVLPRILSSNGVMDNIMRSYGVDPNEIDQEKMTKLLGNLPQQVDNVLISIHGTEEEKNRLKLQVQEENLSSINTMSDEKVRSVIKEFASSVPNDMKPTLSNTSVNPSGTLWGPVISENPQLVYSPQYQDNMYNVKRRNDLVESIVAETGLVSDSPKAFEKVNEFKKSIGDMSKMSPDSIHMLEKQNLNEFNQSTLNKTMVDDNFQIVKINGEPIIGGVHGELYDAIKVASPYMGPTEGSFKDFVDYRLASDEYKKQYPERYEAFARVKQSMLKMYALSGATVTEAEQKALKGTFYFDMATNPQEAMSAVITMVEDDARESHILEEALYKSKQFHSSEQKIQYVKRIRRDQEVINKVGAMEARKELGYATGADVFSQFPKSVVKDLMQNASEQYGVQFSKEDQKLKDPTSIYGKLSAKIPNDLIIAGLKNIYSEKYSYIGGF